MIESFEDLRQVVGLVFSDTSPPRPLHLLEPIALARTGERPLIDLAAQARTTRQRLQVLAGAADPAASLLGTEIPALSPQLEARFRGTLGQLVIGNLAEWAFEDLYKTSVGTTDLVLMDERGSRGDTDYLVFNGMKRQVFRLNIKFHGALFRRAKDLVGLDPQDCFALATYKIHAALIKQEIEHLPYIFVIVGVPGLTGSIVGSAIAEDLVHLCAIAHASPRVVGKRQVEDQIVSRLTSAPTLFGFDQAVAQYSEQIRNAQWFVLSARRADNLLRGLLFERAYALRVRGFARNYPGAELHIHFSLSKDLTPLADFLQVLRDYGMPGLVTRLERGTL